MTDKPEDDTDEIEIQIVDDTPAEDQGKPKAPLETKPDAPEDDEDLEGYSEKVKKRINKLKYDFHAERRAKEEAARLSEEAVAAAARLKAENDQFRQRLHAGDTAFVEQAKQRVTTQLEQAKAKFKSAYEDGDADALTEAQLRMSELKAEEMRLTNVRPQPVAPAPVTSPPPRPAPEPSSRAKVWAQANPWFGVDEERTGFAYGVHERLVKQGVAPDSEHYYNEIDNAVNRVFAAKGADDVREDKTQRRQPGSVVAPASRQAAPAQRVAVLSSSEVALAKRLGVPLKEYAAQKLKGMSNG